MIQVDGSMGEGGGQVLRTSLALALLTGQELRIENIRARRSKPGLRAQHLKAVEAARDISAASTEGASLGSTSLFFKSGEIIPGRYRWDIGTAGATTLVLQTIFIPLSQISAASVVTITGGTHVPWSPCFHYLELQWLPYMRQMGFSAQLEMELAGFYPQGTGRIQATIQPNQPITPLNITQRGALIQIRGISAVANLDRKIAERQRSQVIRRLGDHFYLNDIRIVALPARVKGTFLLLLAEFEASRACFCALGELGKPAEKVADEAIDALLAFLESDGVIDKYLADQLLLPLALASGPSEIRTSLITQHLVTNAEIIRSVLPVNITIQGKIGEPSLISIEV